MIEPIKIEPVKYEVTVQNENRDYRVGDYLNAIDELTCYFTGALNADLDELSVALKMYAENNLK